MKKKNKTIVTVICIILVISSLGLLTSVLAKNVSHSGGSNVGGSQKNTSTTTTPVVTQKPKEWSEYFLPTAFSDFIPYTALVDGDRLIVAGNREFVFYSSDGKNFNSVELTFESVDQALVSGDYIQDIVVFNDRYYFISRKNGLYTCDRDFKDTRLILEQSSLRDLTVGDEGLLVCGVGVVYYSEDIENWKQITVSANYPVAFYVNNQFIVSCGSKELLSISNSGNTVMKLSKPTDYDNTTNKLLESNNQMKSSCIYEDKLAFVGLSGAAYVVSTNDLLNWNLTSIDMDPSFNFEDVCYYDGTFYAVGYPSDGFFGYLFRFDEEMRMWKAVEGISFGHMYQIEVYNDGLYIFGEDKRLYIYE